MYHTCIINTKISTPRILGVIKSPFGTKSGGHYTTDKTTETEQSSLYYISGYVAKKLNIGLEAPSTDINPSVSKFTENVSRGLLSHPTDELYQLAVSLYVYYRDVQDKSCCTKLLLAFKQIYECAHYQFDKPDEILRRFVNCFSKGYSTLKTAEIKQEKLKNNKRERKENSNSRYC